MRKTKRENLNIFIDASLIYMDDYHQREGTRLEIRWTKDEHLCGFQSPLSTIEFDDDVRALSRWRDATFGTTVGMDVTMMSQPLMLASVRDFTQRDPRDRRP